jgi:dTDP-L-rhamnose 4-epimerase
MKTALVTGGAGLIGSHIVDALREEGVRVRVLDRLVRPTHRGRPDWLRDDVEYLIGDVRSPRLLAEAVRGVDLLFHLAAFGGFAPGVAPYFDVNVTAYCRILEAAAAVGAPLRRAVIASSQAVYGEGASACSRHGPFQPRPRDPALLAAGRWEVPCPVCGRPSRPRPTSEHAADPSSPYAVSKHALEQVALRLGPARGVATTMLRFGLTYGPRQSATNPYCGIISLFSQRMLRRRPVVVYEDGFQTRDFVNVVDVARANLAVAFDDRAAGQVYNVGTGVGTGVLEVIRILGELLGVEPDVRRPGWYRSGEVRHLLTDADALNALGWKPSVPVLDGLAGFVDWFRDRPLPPDPFPRGLARMREAGIVHTALGGQPLDTPLPRSASSGRAWEPAARKVRRPGTTDARQARRSGGGRSRVSTTTARSSAV